MIGVFRLESQMLPGNGKFERTGLGSDREVKEATNTAFNFLKANAGAYQRDNQYHNKRLYRQLSGFAGYRYNYKTCPSHSDCAGLYCAE